MKSQSRHNLMGMGALLGLFLAAGGSEAQYPASPPLPDRYKVTLRYDITTPRDVHVAQYDALIEHLKGLDFAFIPPLEKHPPTDREDPGKNQLVGILPSENLLAVFQNPHVASILAVPEKLKEPEDATARVTVRLQLRGGLAAARQRELVEQTRAVLAELGFREALGYDHRGHTREPFTRLVGTMPWGQLLTLTRDLRGFPFGWFAPQIRLSEVPAPLRDGHPILITEVLSDSDPLTPFKEDKEAIPPEGLEKIGADLWKAHGTTIKGEGKKEAAGPIRVEVFLAGSADPDRDASAAGLAMAAPSLFIESQVGQVLLAQVDPRDVAALAKRPEVTLVRLPRTPLGPVAPTVQPPDALDEVLKETGVMSLRARGKKGKGVSIAVVDADFRGWQAMVAAGRLPAKTRFVDVTRQYFTEIYPLPEVGDPDTPGHGTQCALAVALAAPEAELVLVRIVGQSPLELIEIARLFEGDFTTRTLAALQQHLSSTEKQLLHEREVLLRERKQILELFLDDTDERREFGHLGPVFGWLFSDRAWLYDRMAYQEQQERELQERWDRYRRLVSDIVSLKGMHVAVCALNWPTGYALGGASSVVRWFNEKNRGAVWVQAAGNTRGQAWSGPFRDEDGNGALEFAPPTTPFAKGRWTHELAFLKWQPWIGDAEAPKSTTVRVTLQWREAHDPEYFLNPDALREEERDPFARPQARLDVLLLRQVDPEGKTVGADTFDLVARNAAAAVRLEYQPGTAVYETSFNATLDMKNRYALRVISPRGSYWAMLEVEEGRPVYVSLRRENTRATRPSWAPTLPDLERTWELEPRLFIETLAAAGQLGRVIFSELGTNAGTLGVPAEARGVVSVGAVDENGKRTAYSAEGPPAFAELGPGPMLYSPDRFRLTAEGKGGAFGTSLSASLTAGWIGAAFSEGFQRERVLHWLHSTRGRRIGK